MVRKVLKDTNKKLRKRSKEVPSNAKLSKLMRDMQDTLVALGGVGIAAPQIDVFYRVVLIADPAGKRPFFMINPKITHFSEEKNVFQEMCLSVPKKSGMVQRPIQITVEYEDEKRNKCIGVAYDFEARIIQHEINHLDGILFTDLI